MTATNTSNTDLTALQQAEDMAYFKADLCCYSPESPEWWWDVLVGEGDPLYRGFEVMRCRPSRL